VRSNPSNTIRDHFIVPSFGHSEGLRLFRDNIHKLHVIASPPNLTVVQVQLASGLPVWNFVCIYGEPISHKKRVFWERFTSILSPNPPYFHFNLKNMALILLHGLKLCILIAFCVPATCLIWAFIVQFIPGLIRICTCTYSWEARQGLWHSRVAVDVQKGLCPPPTNAR